MVFALSFTVIPLSQIAKERNGLEHAVYDKQQIRRVRYFQITGVLIHLKEEHEKLIEYFKKQYGMGAYGLFAGYRSGDGFCQRGAWRRG
jgi:hypothetical protein